MHPFSLVLSRGLLALQKMYKNSSHQMCENVFQLSIQYTLGLNTVCLSSWYKEDYTLIFSLGQHWCVPSKGTRVHLSEEKECR